ncbi:enterobactin synthetase [Streptomyces sp. NPDC046203]|uniref:enterobactin synthetase n=1 Tax=Streptomyces sp. NPDC046203 TaxID=3154602 RepID=UPI0033C72F3D
MRPPGIGHLFDEDRLAVWRQELEGAGLGLGVALATEPRLAPAGPGEAAAIVPMPGRRRSEFLAGRLAARRALRAVGLDCGDIPRVGRLPRFPPGRAASISHSAGVAVAVARAPGHDTPLGCDLELRPLPYTAARLILREDEEHLLPAWPVTALFSAKEAAWKALAGEIPGSTLRDLRAGADGAAWADGAGEADGAGRLRVSTRQATPRTVRVRVRAAGPGVFSVVLGRDTG